MDTGFDLAGDQLAAAPSVRVLSVEDARASSAFDAVAKTYEYRIHRGRSVAVRLRYVHFPYPLDEGAFIGWRDFEGARFSSFAASTTATIWEIQGADDISQARGD
jgi:hypothetical protein